MDLRCFKLKTCMGLGVFDRPAGKLALVNAASLVLCTVVSTSMAGTASANTFKSRSADGVMVFSDAPIKDGKVSRTSYSAGLRTTGPVRNPCKGVSFQELKDRAQRLDPLFTTASQIHGVDIALLKAVAQAESCFDQYAVSRVGAKGIMQLMPDTAAQMGVINSFDKRQNVLGGARYLAKMLARYSNKQDLALAAYNAGPGNVDKYKGIPPFKETRRYIKAVKGHQKVFASQLVSANSN